MLVPARAYGLWSVFKNLIPLIGIYALAPLVADHSLVLAWLLFAPAGLLLYRLTMVMHDCGHATLFASRRANSVVGKFLGHLTGIDFASFRDRHWEHHRNYGLADDPQGFHYRGWAGMSRRAKLWHLAKPLLAFNLPYVLPESLFAPRNLGRLFATGEILPFVVVQLGCAALLTGGGRHLSLALIPLAGAATVGLFLSQLRGIAEHGALLSGDSTRCVRSHTGDWLGRTLLYDVHFNLHAEHHDRPGIPSGKLPALVGATATTGGPTMWRTLGTMLRSR